MVERVQPLAAIAAPGTHGVIGEDGPGIVLSLPPRGSLWQVAPWPETYAEVAGELAAALGLSEMPAPGRLAACDGERLVTRVEPLKFWVFGPDGAEAPLTPEPDRAMALDLSHNDSAVRVEGRNARDLLARIVSIDLRQRSFPDMSFATTQAHHMITRVLRRDSDGPGYEIMVMRSFAEVMWDLLVEHGAQFGLEVRA